MATMNLQPAANADDGYGHSSGPTFDASSTTAFFGNNSLVQQGFIRFTLDADLTGATIDTAVLTIYVDAQGAGNTETTLRLNDADDAAAPTTWSALDGLTLTTAGQFWDITTSAEEDKVSPDFAAVIQEYVDSYTAANGDHITVVLDCSTSAVEAAREFHTLESTQEAPRLAITYTPAAVGGDHSLVVDLNSRQFIREVR